MQDIECPHCGNEFYFEDGEDIGVDVIDMAGKLTVETKCPDCRQSFKVVMFIEIHCKPVKL